MFALMFSIQFTVFHSVFTLWYSTWSQMYSAQTNEPEIKKNIIYRIFWFATLKYIYTHQVNISLWYQSKLYKKLWQIFSMCFDHVSKVCNDHLNAGKIKCYWITSSVTNGCNFSWKDTSKVGKRWLDTATTRDCLDKQSKRNITNVHKKHFT